MEGVIKAMSAIIGVTVAVIIYAFSTFATKDQIRESVIDRLDRIELKLDRVLEKQ